MYSVLKCKSRQLLRSPNNSSSSSSIINNNNNINNNNKNNTGAKSSIVKKYHTTEILHTEMDFKCRLCIQFDGTEEHVISVCPILAKEKYIKRCD